MPTRELNTATKIETAPAPSKPGFRIYHAPRVSGHSGLALRVVRGETGTVSRTLQVITRGPDRREQRIFVSSWPLASDQVLSDVLLRACEIRDRIKKGLPAYPPAPADDAQEAEPSVKQIWLRYTKAHASDQKASTVKNDDRLWRCHIEPVLGGKRPSELTYDNLKKWYQDIAAKSVANANRSYQVLKAAFNFSSRKWPAPWAQRNPLELLGPEDRKPEKVRTIVLNAKSYNRLMACIREHPVSTPKPPRPRKRGTRYLSERQTADCLLLIALTGCRKREALDAHWAEFDLSTGVWTIPAVRTKQARTVRLPLVSEALEHLKNLYARRSGDALVFPQSRDPKKAQNSLKKGWATIIKRAGLTEVINLEDGTSGPLRIHDLRHVFGTSAAEAGLRLEVIAGLLGHSQLSTTRRYVAIHDEILKAGASQLGAHLKANLEAKSE